MQIDAGPESMPNEWQQTASALVSDLLCWGRLGGLGPLHALDMNFAGVGSDATLEQDGVESGGSGDFLVESAKAQV